MKATARAHPIQGLVKYHGMRDSVQRFPYHDSISVCTAPANTTTTVAFDADFDEDHYVVDGDKVTGRAAERIDAVVERVRTVADTDLPPVRLESRNDFPTNIGFGSSSSGFAAAAVALAEAAGVTGTRSDISTIARLGSASAARSVTGGYSDLRAGTNNTDCRSHRLTVPDSFSDNHRIVAAMIPAYKETEAAHEEAADSHMFQARLAHVHAQLADMRDALHSGATDRVFEIAEHDSLSLAATTMTGPSGWVYWQPKTLEVFETVRRLRENDVTAYFSVDTGASVYINTTVDAVDTVEAAIADLGIDTRVWEVGGPAELLDPDAALF